MATDITKMTIRRLVKGQPDRISRMANWKQILCDALKEIYHTAGVNLSPAKMRIVHMGKAVIQTTECAQQWMNDSRLANQQTLVLFQYGGTLHYLVCDNNRLKIMLSKTNKYSFGPDTAYLYDMNKPFICIQANMSGDLDPRPWKGIPFAHHFVVAYTNKPGRGGKKK